MADGVGINPGTQVTIATDEVNLGAGLVQSQIMKLIDGTDGGTNRLVITAAGAAKMVDVGVHTAAKNFSLSLATGSWTEAKSGIILANRVTLLMQNYSDTDIEVSFSNVAALGEGTVIPAGQTMALNFGTIPVYLQPLSGSGKRVNIIEGA